MKTFATVIISAILIYVALLVTQEPQAPEVVPLTPAEEACLEETNAALERAGQTWASMMERADSLSDAASRQQMNDVAMNLYEQMVERIMNQYEVCVWELTE